MKNTGLWIGVALLVIAGVFIGLYQSSSDVATSGVNEKPASATIVLSEAPLPLRVSGLVEASDRTIVSAKTAGVLTQLTAREGSVVYKGMQVALQETPVADAQVYAATSQQALTSLTQSLAAEQAGISLQQAEAVAYGAHELATLSGAANESALSDTTKQLLATTELNLSVLTDALNYIDDHKAYFDQQDLKTYQELVQNLYGTIPKQFAGGVATPIQDTTDLRAQLEVLKTSEAPAVVAVQNAASLTSAQLSLVSTLLNAAETDIYNQRQVDPQSTSYSAYITNRSAVLSAQSAQLSAERALQHVVDTTLSEAATQTKTVAVSDLDTDAARLQARYSEAIKAAALEVASAERAVIVAQQSLRRVTAPFAGVVAEVFAREGEYLTPGAPVLSLLGTKGQEITVSIPSVVGASLTPGAVFEVGGREVGVLNRLGAPTSGGVMVGVITLTTDRYQVGDTVVGSLVIPTVSGVYVVQRSALHFDSYGPYVVYTDGTSSRARVIYDQGEQVFVSVEEYKPDTLQPASVFNLAV